MITKETFEAEKKKLEEMLEAEKNTMDAVIMNINKIQAALNWITAELEKYPKENPVKKKRIFK